VTGVAGPLGGTDEKPVGTVHVVVEGPEGSSWHNRAQFPANRARVRELTSQRALDMLRRVLLGVDPLP